MAFILYKRLAVTDRIGCPAPAPVSLLSRFVPVAPVRPGCLIRMSLVVWIKNCPAIVPALTISAPGRPPIQAMPADAAFTSGECLIIKASLSFFQAYLAFHNCFAFVRFHFSIILSALFNTNLHISLYSFHIFSQAPPSPRFFISVVYAVPLLLIRILTISPQLIHL